MRGFSLTIDVTFAAFIVAFILVALMSYMNTSYSSGVSELSMKRLATDIIAVLDYNGTLDTLNASKIQGGVNNLLPENLVMGLNISVYNRSLKLTSVINIGYQTEKERYGGRWGFMKFNRGYARSFGLVEYWIAAA